MFQHIKVPADGQKITVNADFSLNVPDNPVTTALLATINTPVNPPAKVAVPVMVLVPANVVPIRFKLVMVPP